MEMLQCLMTITHPSSHDCGQEKVDLCNDDRGVLMHFYILELKNNQPQGVE